MCTQSALFYAIAEDSDDYEAHVVNEHQLVDSMFLGTHYTLWKPREKNP
jgi:hypothetical protein